MGGNVAHRVDGLDGEACVSHSLLHEASTQTLIARGGRNARDRNLLEQGLLVVELQMLESSLHAGITKQQINVCSPIKATGLCRHLPVFGVVLRQKPVAS